MTTRATAFTTGLGAVAMAFLLAGTPARAGVHVGINIPAPPSIVIEAPPRLVVVPNLPTVQYAPDVSYNYFSYRDRYYTYHNDAWFTASAYNGPWVYVDAGRVPRALRGVPVRYYRVPPGHRRGHHKGHGHD